MLHRVFVERRWRRWRFLELLLGNFLLDSEVLCNLNARRDRRRDKRARKTQRRRARHDWLSEAAATQQRISRRDSCTKKKKKNTACILEQR